MVFLSSLLIASSVAISSFSPGVEAAVIPLPLQRTVQRPLMQDTFTDHHPRAKRGLKVSPLYDPNHSQHWNYHHGYVNKDAHGHGPPHKRSDGPARMDRRKSSAYFDDSINVVVDDLDDLGLDLKKRDSRKSGKPYVVEKTEETLASVDVDILKRHDGHSDHWDHDHWDDWGHGPVHEHDHKRELNERHHDHWHGDEHVHEHSYKRDVNERRDDHWHGHDHEHEHDHYDEHRHHHARSGHVTGEHHKDERKGSKGKKAHSFGFKEEKKGKGDKQSSEKKPEKKSEKRALAVSGVPGFVEVATQLFNSTLSRSIAGLVYTSNPDASSNATSFILGTSTVESTEFYLTQAPASLADASINVVNIRIPILNSQQMNTVDYCATFDLSPPSPLSLLPCGDLAGFSQNFAYNETTSELQPLYSSTPAPMALVENPSDNEASPKSFASTNSSQDDDSAAPAQSISLFFVPASTYYQAPVAIPELFASSDDSSSTSASSDAMISTTSLPASSSATQMAFTSTSSVAASSATPASATLSSASSSSASPTSMATSMSMATPVSMATPMSMASPSSSDDPMDTTINIDTDSDSLSTSTVTLTMATAAPTGSRFMRW